MATTFDLPGQVLRLTLIISRLRRDYDYYVFYNGGYTGGSLPWMAFKAHGWDEAAGPEFHTFSNGLVVPVGAGDIIIHLGPLVATGNLKPASLSPIEKETEPT
jgi:hypothetical protein